MTLPLLHTSGTKIYDINGNQFKIWMCDIQNGEGSPVTLAHLQNIKNMGFNTIRWNVPWIAAQPSNNSSVNTAYFTLGSGGPANVALDNVVAWAESVGLYVDISPGWSGSWVPPTWAGGASVNLTDASVQAGINYLYGWMAAHYASNTNVIFESFNEIDTSSQGAMTISAFPAFNNGWLSAIEANEGSIKHLKIVELLLTWTGWNYSLTPPFIAGTHSNVVIATHSYPLVNSITTIATQCAQAWSDAILGAGYPWMDTEFSTAVGGDYSGLAQGAGLLMDYGANGWGYFCYDSFTDHESNWNIANSLNAASILPILQPYMTQPTTNPILTVNSSPLTGITFTLRRVA